MNRIFDFTPVEERVVINRILVQVHKAVDQHFPDAKQASFQFRSTVFSDDDEHTAIVKAAIEMEKESKRRDKKEGSEPKSIATEDTTKNEIEPASFWDNLDLNTKIATIIIFVCVVILVVYFLFF